MEYRASRLTATGVEIVVEQGGIGEWPSGIFRVAHRVGAIVWPPC
jgi:hypothetical protein